MPNRNSKISDGLALHRGSELYAINRVTADRHGQNAWLVNLSRGGKTFQMTSATVPTAVKVRH